MTKREFRESRKTISPEEYHLMFGFSLDDADRYDKVSVYDSGLYIGIIGKKYYLPLGRDEFVSKKINKLEKKLYKWAKGEIFN